jgi:hypothetical protein
MSRPEHETFILPRPKAVSTAGVRLPRPMLERELIDMPDRAGVEVIALDSWVGAAACRRCGSRRHAAEAEASMSRSCPARARARPVTFREGTTSTSATAWRGPGREDERSSRSPSGSTTPPRPRAAWPPRSPRRAQSSGRADRDEFAIVRHAARRPRSPSPRICCSGSSAGCVSRKAAAATAPPANPAIR